MNNEDENVQHPSLLAGWCVAGIGADVARNITELSLEGALDLPTLTTVSLVLAGTLRHVRTLKLNTSPCGAGGFRNFYALHSALRGAFPALQELCLPGMACLRGLEAFAGSSLHTVRILTCYPGLLRHSHVRSLLRLSQLRRIDLAGAGRAIADWHNDVWDDADDADDADVDADAEDDAEDDADADVPVGAVEDLALGDATLLESLRELSEEEMQEKWAVRRLLASAPLALKSLLLPANGFEVHFVGGRITRAVTSEWVDYYQGGLHHLAAAILPRLEATGQRLPLLKVEVVVEGPAEVISLLQPQTAFARLLSKCDRVELGRLMLSVDGEAAAPMAAAALQGLARAMGGGLPEELVVCGSSWSCTLQMRRRCQRAEGGDGGRVAAADGRGCSDGHGPGGAATAAGAAATELTAEQVLERAAAKGWAAASAQGTASMAEAALDAYVAAAGGADSQERTSLYKDLELVDVLLRGPFVRQLTCGSEAGGGAPLLTNWLRSLVAAGPPPPPPPPPLDAAAAAPRVGMCACSFAPCGSGSAMAVVMCDCPLTALQLHRAAAAAACKTPGCLEVSAVEADCCGGEDCCWSSAIDGVIQELWDDHLRSVTQPTEGAARAAAAGTAAGTGAEVDGPAGEPERVQGGGPGDAAAGGGGGGGGGGGDDGLQVLMRLLQLVEQAHAAVVRVELDRGGGP
ncbi:hypothetical protein HXX76_015604 [Chlamydomonas incerta]|uniref:Uncharacterized protein n=1 Tax=Chlamydomonas incerta TaxID=51695 RepID=A0A835SN75_CHLIN|nr:hypothetical protein HXX76_015604 [Chlamydomonas incerta]|eukprot:KAG2423006.1 hypothetical protein HXX76_015604 [Chlamydomonas incerta]